MNWLPVVIETILKFYSQVQITKKTADKAKEIAIQSSIIALGSVVLLVLLLAGVVILFVDLGNQLEAKNGIHFSGLMWSSVFLTLLGVLVFGICFFMAKYFGAKEKVKAIEEQAAKPSFGTQYAPLIVLGEEILKQYLEKVVEKKNAPPAQTASPTQSHRAASTPPAGSSENS